MTDNIRAPGKVRSVKGIAGFLGISESKVRQLIRRKAIPYFKIDGSYKFYLPVVEEWLRSITVRPTGEAEVDDAQMIANRIWKTTTGE